MTLLIALMEGAGGFGELNGHEFPGYFISVLLLVLTPLVICGLLLLIALITFVRLLVSRRHSIAVRRSSPKS